MNYCIDRILSEDEIAELSEADSLNEARKLAKAYSLETPNFPIGIFIIQALPTPKEYWINGTKRSVQEVDRTILEGWEEGQPL